MATKKKASSSFLTLFTKVIDANYHSYQCLKFEQDFLSKEVSEYLIVCTTKQNELELEKANTIKDINSKIYSIVNTQDILDIDVYKVRTGKKLSKTLQTKIVHAEVKE